MWMADHLTAKPGVSAATPLPKRERERERERIGVVHMYHIITSLCECVYTSRVFTGNII
jgi:hypothetical protein